MLSRDNRKQIWKNNNKISVFYSKKAIESAEKRLMSEKKMGTGESCSIKREGEGKAVEQEKPMVLRGKVRGGQLKVTASFDNEQEKFEVL